MVNGQGSNMAYELLDDEQTPQRRGFTLIDEPAEKPRTIGQKINQFAGDTAAAVASGAGEIGATLMAPLDAIAQTRARPLLKFIPGVNALAVVDDALGRGTIIGRDDRRKSLEPALQSMGANPDSLWFKGVKLGTQIAGTSGVGGVLAKGAQAIPALARFAPALQSGGFTLGDAATKSRLANAAIRAGAGGISGATMAGLVNPEDAPEGGMIGAILPPAIKGFGAAGSAIRNRIVGPQSPLSAQRLASAQQGAAAGYVIPPADLSPSAATEILSGLSGKIKTAQVASYKNQAVTDRLARQELGMAADDALTADVLQGIRNSAAQAYAPVRQAGMVTADDTFKNSLNKIAETYQGANSAFPGLAKNDVGQMVDTLRVGQFDASGAVDAIRVLRESADKAFRTGDTGMGKAAKAASQALEDQLERHLSSTGNKEALQALKDARQLIAKTYSVQKALNSETGSVSAQVLAKQLEKGKPLSGDLLTIAKMGSAFPKATQALKEAPKSFSPFDFFVSGGASMATANPIPMLGILARPTARSYLLSPTAQRAALAPPVMADPNSIGLLSNAAYRSAPVLGAGLLRPDQ